MRYFASQTKAPLTFSVCGQLISKDNFLHHRRCFDQHVLILVTEGTLHITTNAVPYTVNPGEYIFLKAGEEHFGHKPSSGKLSYLWVHINADTGFSTLKNSSIPEDPSLFSYLFCEYGKTAPAKRIPLLFRQLMDLSMEESLYTPAILNYSVSLLLMELSQECISMQDDWGKQIPYVISSALDWIRTNYYRPFSVTELADELGYQADYLSALFKRSMGISLIQYTNKLRIETAKNLLANYDLSIKEAAYSCGFPDEKYFMKVFKKMIGITPTQYKNAFSKKNIN